MSIELKQAAQQALSALEKSQPHPSNPVIGLTNQDFADHEETIRQLRAAIQQAEAQQPATGEPVGYMNEGHIHELAMRRLPYGYVYPEAGAGASTAVYTRPAPSVPEGYALVPIEPTQAMLNVPTWDFNRFYSPREIWAAMLAAK